MNTHPKINDETKTRILAELAQLEQAEEVTVLYACESGSRAWGFESEDSDYDVRFIYLRRTPWYLSIQDKRDVIEKPIDDELDISGWDLPKALQLLRKSNPPLLEWMQSPIVYQQTSSFVDRLRDLMGEYYSPISCMYHYLHMAENNYRKYLKETLVWTKKYFYVLRPVLACIWIEKGLGVVPIEFGKLVDGVVEDTQLRTEIEILLEKKRSGAELDRGPKNRILSGFLETQLDRLRAEAQRPAKTRNPATLDLLFLEVLKEVNGARIGETV
ncbi:MAG: nucleotidyltransferase domain-containing protein [Verrucomicrobia bacterium]|nr:nucleotidyltransferase domain-containing protein [Verrucomicrobiota bacterium]